jgi:hypothetical protein
MKPITLQQFLDRANKYHNNKYDYSLVYFKNNKSNIIIICPIHGNFSQRLKYHLEGHECPKCGLINRSNPNIPTKIKPIARLKNPPRIKKEPKRKMLLFLTKTLGEVIAEKYPTNKYHRVRTNARFLFKRKLSNSCEHCGYEKHVELCHIKPIASFPENTFIKEINSEKNLISLCPNCHWELDNGLITI